MRIEVPTANLTQIRHIGAENFRIASLGAQDSPQVERLFARVFGTEPSPGWYTWKYGDLGGTAIGLWNDHNELVAHYAGFTRTLLWQGQVVPAIQIGDVMVAPEVRGFLTRHGPFFQVCSQFFATQVGPGQKHALAFGFPNERAIRLGVTLGLYRNLGQIRQIHWPAHCMDLPLGWKWTRLLPNSFDLERTVNKVWHDMALDFSGHVVGVRNWDHIQSRFVKRPDQPYDFFCLRRWLPRRAVAIAVMRLTPGQAQLLDVIGPRNDFPLVIRAAIQQAAQVGATHLTAWGSNLACDVFQRCGASVGDVAAQLAASVTTTLAQDRIEAAPWWWMGGDTDFL